MSNQPISLKERAIRIALKTVRGLEKLLCVFPVRKNRIYFQSFGHAEGYSCNPKYICEYLKEHSAGQYELVWAFRDPGQFAGISGITPVKHKSLKWLYYMYTSKVLVLNEGPSAYLAKRKGQYLIQTWHGGGAYKRVGFGRGDLSPLWEWIYETTGRDIDLFLAAGEVPGKTSAWETYHYKGEILKSGTPRNDVLADEVRREAVSEAVRTRLGIKDAYVVLYAPTFRNTAENLDVVFSFRKLCEVLEKRFGKKVVLLVRAHRYNTGEYRSDAKALDVTDYPDMQELLCAADMMITDYSSCMWDYALLKRPCLLFVPDLDQYENGRGFFTPIKDWPGFICRTEEELFAAAETFDPKACAEKAERHLELLGSYETGHAAEMVCERIRQVVRS